MTKGDIRWIENWKPKGVSMNTTRKVAAKKVVKKKPAKRAYRKDSMDSDFLNRHTIEGITKDITDLQWKINIGLKIGVE